MADRNDGASFKGDDPVAAYEGVLPDRRELAIVAVERTRMPMIVTDPKQADNPIVLANQAFLELTGYSGDEVLGRNCRFLQGPATDEAEVASIRRALERNEDHIAVELVNYRKDGSTFWNQLAISAVRDFAGELTYYFASQRDVTSQRKTQKLEEAERRLLMEVDHRAMNALALVQSIVSLSRTDSIERFCSSIKSRVDALARAHRLLARLAWSAVDLRDLVKAELGDTQVELSGPPVRLSARQVQPVCLVLHEFFSNAREHGALSRPEGHVSLYWQVAEADLTIHWLERGASIDPSSPPPNGMGAGLSEGHRRAAAWRLLR